MSLKQSDDALRRRALHPDTPLHLRKITGIV